MENRACVDACSAVADTGEASQRMLPGGSRHCDLARGEEEVQKAAVGCEAGARRVCLETGLARDDTGVPAGHCSHGAGLDLGLAREGDRTLWKPCARSGLPSGTRSWSASSVGWLRASVTGRWRAWTEHDGVDALFYRT